MLNKPHTFLIVDDEPYYLDWVVEFIEIQKYQVEIQSSFEEALTSLSSVNYIGCVFDMNIPIPDHRKNEIISVNPVFGKYPGLYLARFARNHSYHPKTVIVYTVHDDPAISAMVNTINCIYTLKGKPKEFKKHIKSIIAYNDSKIGN